MTGALSRLPAVAVIALAACSSEPATPEERVREALASDLEELFPGIDVVPATACLSVNATEAEFAALARERVDTTAVTRSIFERPETLTCLQANGVIEVMEILI